MSNCDFTVNLSDGAEIGFSLDRSHEDVQMSLRDKDAADDDSIIFASLNRLEVVSIVSVLSDWLADKADEREHD